MARYLIDKRLLIQHIPRCGGTWVEDALQACGVNVLRWVEQAEPWIARKHSLLAHYRRESMVQVDFVAAFVRHPVAYYESVWKFLGSRGPGKRQHLWRHFRWHPHASASRLYHQDFNEWINRMLSNQPCWCTRLFEQYVGPKGGAFCDFIGRTETLEEDFIALMRAFGYPVDCWIDRLKALGLRNAVSRKIEWDPELLQKTLTSERLIINRFYEGRRRKWFNHFKDGPPIKQEPPYLL